MRALDSLRSMSSAMPAATRRTSRAIPRTRGTAGASAPPRDRAVASGFRPAVPSFDRTRLELAARFTSVVEARTARSQYFSYFLSDPIKALPASPATASGRHSCTTFRMTLSRQRSDIGVRLSERRSGKGDKSDFLRQRQTQPVHHCSSGAVLLTLLRS